MAAWVEQIGRAALEAAAQAGLPVELSPLAAGAAALALVAAIALLVLTGLAAGLRKRPHDETAAPLPPQSHPQAVRQAAPNEQPLRQTEAVQAPIQGAPSPALADPAPPPARAAPPQLPPEAILRPFISYSRSDADFAEAVFAALEAHGHAPIMDRKDIVPNEPWQERLDELILESDAVAFLLSPNWLQSEVCRRELRCAEDHGKLFTSVQFGALNIGDVPAQLSRRNFVNFQSSWPVNENNQSAFDAAIDRLIVGLEITKTLWRRDHTKWMARAEAWRAAKMSQDNLLPPGETAEIQQWVGAKPVEEDALPPLLLQFIDASVAAAGKLSAMQAVVIGELDVIDGFADLPPDHVRRLPTALVVADYGVIPFDDSRGLLADLLVWARDRNSVGAAGRLYAAAGGYGKTRLALEAVAKLKAEGWRAGLLPRAALEKVNVRGEQDGDERLARFFAGRGERGAFLALDYSEGRTGHIERVTRAALAAQASSKTGGPIRIMLLARGAGEWWNGLLDARREIQAVFDRKAFEAIGGDIVAEQRPTFFRAAAQAFAQLLGVAQDADDLLLRADWESVPIPERRLASADVGSPLSLAFEAFLHVRGVALEGSPLAEMAREERRHWSRALKRKATDVTAINDPRLDALHRCAAVVTLGGGFGPAAEDAVDGCVKYMLAIGLKRVERLGVDDIARADALAAVRTGLENLYRSRRADGDVLSPILPDLLGERLVAEAITRAPGMLGDVLDNDGAADSNMAFTILNRINRRDHRGTTVHDTSLVESARVSITDALKGRLGIKNIVAINRAFSVEDAYLDVSILDAIKQLTPNEQGRVSNQFLNVFTGTGLINPNMVPARLAVFLGELLSASAVDAHADADMTSNPTTATGPTRAELYFAREADDTLLTFSVLDQMIKNKSDKDLYDTYYIQIREITNLIARSQMLSNLGRHMEAAPPAELAIEKCKELDQAPYSDTAAWKFYTKKHLAMALGTLGTALIKAGDITGGTKSCEMCVTTLMADPKPDDPDWHEMVGTALFKLTEPYFRNGQLQKTLAVGEDSIGHLQKAVSLGQKNAIPILADALSSLGGMKASAGVSGGDADIRASLSLYDQLGIDDLHSQGVQRARAWTNLSLIDQGSTESIDAGRRALAIYERVAEQNPLGIESEYTQAILNLASSLGARGNNLMAAGGALNAREAMTSFLEALQVSTPLFRKDGGRFDSLVKQLLNSFMAAARMAGLSDNEVRNTLEALSLNFGGGYGQSHEVALYKSWVRAHVENRVEDAHSAYNVLVAALNADLANSGLDKMRDVIVQARQVAGVAWPYGDVPRRR